MKISEKFYDFREIDDVRKVEFHYNRTIMPPKKFFFPPREKLFEFTVSRAEYRETLEDVEPFVVFGIHSCDIFGLKILDTVYLDEFPDKYYRVRREKGIIVGISCMPDEYCFCNLRETDFADDGFDLFLHELPDGWLVRVGTPTGHRIVDRNIKLFEEVSTEDICNFREFENKRSKAFKYHEDWSNLRYLLELEMEHPMWEEQADICLACGNCNLTCPTCRCYEVQDIVNLDGGHRLPREALGLLPAQEPRSGCRGGSQLQAHQESPLHEPLPLQERLQRKARHKLLRRLRKVHLLLPPRGHKLREEPAHHHGGARGEVVSAGGKR